MKIKTEVLSNPGYYKLRQRIIEHQFGILKRQWGFSFTLMAGKVNVLSEVNLLMMVYNLSRSISILGLNELKKKLNGFSTCFLTFFELITMKIKTFLELGNPRIILVQ